MVSIVQKVIVLNPLELTKSKLGILGRDPEWHKHRKESARLVQNSTDRMNMKKLVGESKV